MRASNGGERAVYPGAAAASASGSLNQLESDIAAKTRASGGPTATRAIAPGAVAASNLSQLERDIENKTNGGGEVGRAAANDGVAHGLSQLEQDVVSKSRAGPNMASQPGAVSGSALSRLEQDIAAKTQANTSSNLKAPPSEYGAGSAASASALNQMEDDIRAKNQARGPARATAPGVAAAASASSSLDQLERDVATKNSLRSGAPATVPGVASNSLNRLEEDIMAKNRSSNHSYNSNPSSASNARAALNQLELDAVAKSNARGDVPPSYGPGSNLSNLEQFEANMMQSNRVDTAYGTNMPYEPGMYNYSNNVPYHSEPPLMYEQQPAYDYNSGYNNYNQDTNMMMARTGPIINDPYSREPDYQPDYAIESTPSSHPPIDNNAMVEPPVPDAAVTASVALADPEAPLYATGDSMDIAGAETGGIEAFVAENVVDATGVAVIMSDEEEAIMEKRRQRRLFCCGCLCVVIVLIAVIVPLSQKSSPAAPPPTFAPTAAPTFAPTLAPTSDAIPKAAKALSAYSSLTDLQNRNSAQFAAMDWLVNTDKYAKTEGLTYTDPKWIQRYIMAVFYFHFKGDSWTYCNRKDEVCQSSKDASSWLSNNDECTWWLLGCENSVLNKINFGTWNTKIVDSLFGVLA
jgi:hypothetical protein